MIWALTLVIAIKYATFVLRADNDGEGGVFALYGLLDRFTRRGMPLLMWTLLLGAGLLLGDGMITPAISVLSAVEGVAVAAPLFAHTVIPITLAVLTLLFAFQSWGTGGIGKVFGPIMVVWFLVIAGLGIVQIVHAPRNLVGIRSSAWTLVSVQCRLAPHIPHPGCCRPCPDGRRSDVRRHGTLRSAPDPN